MGKLCHEKYTVTQNSFNGEGWVPCSSQTVALNYSVAAS